MLTPLAIDLFCGLGGWTEGLLAEGYRIVGFDNERHRYPARDFSLAEEYGKGMSGKNSRGTTLISAAREQVHGFHRAPLTGGWHEYPAQLVIQDVLTLHGRQFKDAALIVASPPCQAYSYRAMPWKRAKALPPPDNALFEACFRIQREACEAAGQFIPLVVENVCGAQKWVGRARWHYGSFYLWGDVPALMPITRKAIKVPTMGAGWYPPDHPKHVRGLAFNGHADRNLRLGDGVKAGDRNKARATGGHSWTAGFDNHVADGVKGSDGYERSHPQAFGWKKPGTSSHSTARKAASAHIAKIPYELARHIARAWWPC